MRVNRMINVAAGNRQLVDMGTISARAFIVICLVVSSAVGFKIGILIEDEPPLNVRHEAIEHVLRSVGNLLNVNTAIAANVSIIWLNLKVSHNTLAAGAVCQLMSQGAGGLISVLHPRSCKFVTDQARVYSLPHVALPLGDCTSSHTADVNLQLTSLPLVAAQIVRDIAVHEDWREVVLLFDETTDTETRARCLMLLSNSIIPASIVTINRGDGRGKLTERMGSISEFVVEAIFLLCNAENVKRVFQEAPDLNMTTPRHYWVVFADDDDIVSSIAADILARTNILLVRQSWSKTRACDQTCQGLDNCPVCDRIANAKNMSVTEAMLADGVLNFVLALNKMAVRGEVFESDNIVNCTTRPSASITNGLEIQTALTQTQLNGFMCSGGFNEQGLPRFIEYDVMSNVQANTALQHVATWKRDEALSLKQDRLFLKTFVDFNGRILRVVALEALPFNIKETRGGETVFTGLCFDILNELSSRLNFTYDIIEGVDGLYGGPNDDGTVDGMVGMVKRGEVDMAVAPFTVTSLRETVIDFTTPFIQDGIGILTKRPDIDSQKQAKLLKPFHTEVWAVIAGSVVIVGVVSFFVNRLTPFSAWRRKFPESTEDEVTLGGNVWTVYRCIVDQGAETHPRALSGMVILASWWMFMIVVVATYTANLAGILTVTLPIKPINSLSELVAQQKIIPLIKKGTNLVDLFTNAKSGLYRQVGDMMGDMPSVSNTDKAVQMVVDTGLYAYMSDRSQLEYRANKKCKSYALADEVFNTAGLAFVVPENAPYRQAMNLNIMKMQESGLIERWRQHWWSQSQDCGSSDRTSGGGMGLDLETMSGLFIIYAGTIGLAVLLLVLQRIVGCKRAQSLIEKLKSMVIPRWWAIKRVKKNATSEVTPHADTTTRLETF